MEVPQPFVPRFSYNDLAWKSYVFLVHWIQGKTFSLNFNSEYILTTRITDQARFILYYNLDPFSRSCPTINKLQEQIRFHIQVLYLCNFQLLRSPFLTLGGQVLWKAFHHWSCHSYNHFQQENFYMNFWLRNKWQQIISLLLVGLQYVNHLVVVISSLWR